MATITWMSTAIPWRPLAAMEEVLAAPAAYFGEMAGEVDRYAHQPPRRRS